MNEVHFTPSVVLIGTVQTSGLPDATGYTTRNWKIIHVDKCCLYTWLLTVMTHSVLNNANAQQGDSLESWKMKHGLKKNIKSPKSSQMQLLYFKTFKGVFSSMCVGALVYGCTFVWVYFCVGALVCCTYILRQENNLDCSSPGAICPIYLKTYYYFMHMCECLHVCICTTCVPSKARRHQIFVELE